MLTFGSLDQNVRGYAEGAALLASAGPVSDAFIQSRGARDLLNGPVGSGKTTACIKRALLAAVRTPPILGKATRDGKPIRHYRLAVWRETYQQLWGTTIKSWQKVLNPDRGVGQWQGASPRPARHLIEFEDAFGPIQFEALFLAFGDDADPDDLGGTEYTDVYLNEMDKLREALFINLARSVGRYPNRGELGLADDPRLVHGRIFGDCNAPSPETWVYRDWWSVRKPPGYQLFRQPGGFDPAAENVANVGRAYYAQQAEANANRPWWIRVKIHNEPGYNQEAAVVYPKFSDARMVSAEPLKVFPEIPVVLAIDGGNTPAACFTQAMPDGQLRVLHEVVIDRGSETDLARGINAVIALPRFRGCEFHFTGDEALFAGEDTTDGSYIARVAKLVNLKAHRPAAGNADTEGRHFAGRQAMELMLSNDRPGFMLDGVHCPVIRRGLNGTFRYHVNRQTGQRGGIVKNPDSHVVEAMEYALGESGKAHARKRQSERLAARVEARRKAERQPAYHPLQRYRVTR